MIGEGASCQVFLLVIKLWWNWLKITKRQIWKFSNFGFYFYFLPNIWSEILGRKFNELFENSYLQENWLLLPSNGVTCDKWCGAKVWRISNENSVNWFIFPLVFLVDFFSNWELWKKILKWVWETWPQFLDQYY